jgi:hypothetical protein
MISKVTLLPRLLKEVVGMSKKRKWNVILTPLEERASEYIFRTVEMSETNVSFYCYKLNEQDRNAYFWYEEGVGTINTNYD